MQPSAFFPVFANWVAENETGKWRGVREQYWIFPGIGLSQVMQVDFDSYLGSVSRGNVTTRYFLKGPQYSYIADRAVQRIMLKSPDGKVVWVHELQSYKRSDKIGVENKVKRSYLMTAAYGWRTILRELDRYRSDVKLRASYTQAARIDSLDLSTYPYERNLVSAVDTRQVEPVVARRYLGFILAMLDEEPPAGGELASVLGDVPSEIAAFAAPAVMAELENKDRTQGFRFRCYDWLARVRPGGHALLLVLIERLQRMQPNPKAVVARPEVDAERVKVAQLLESLTGERWGEDYVAWKKWLAKQPRS